MPQFCNLLQLVWGSGFETAACGLLHIHVGKAAQPTMSSRILIALQMLQGGCQQQ